MKNQDHFSGASNLGRHQHSNSNLSLLRFTEPGLDTTISAVMENLQPLSLGLSLAEIRKAYSASRRPLAGALPPVRTILKIGIDGGPPLTLFYPSSVPPDGFLPALLFLHGGGWTLGELDIYEPFCRALASQLRTVVVWVEYRLAPEAPFPAAVEDSWAAAQWLQKNAAYLGIDPNQIGIGGDSAGGNLAAVTALAARDKQIAFDPAYQLLLYPCLDLTTSAPSHERFAEGYLLTAEVYRWYRQNYLAPGTRLTDWRVSPFFASRFDQLPPTIILTAGFDPLCDEGALYAGKLRAANVRTVTIQFPRMIHGFLTMRGAVPAAQVAVERIAAVIERMRD
jgi:acetyl esterase